MILVGDDDLRQTGYYVVGLERIRTASPDASVIERGTLRPGTFFSAVQKDQYVFNGTAGQIVDLAIKGQSTQPGFVATAKLFTPSGVLFKTFSYASGNQRLALTETGNYLLQIADNDLRQTGSYSVGLEGIKTWSSDAVALSRDTWVNRNVFDYLQKDQFVFSGAKNQHVTVQATRSSNSPDFDPLIEIFDTAGTRISWFRASAGAASFTLPWNSQYLIQVSESGFDALGSYSLRWL